MKDDDVIKVDNLYFNYGEKNILNNCSFNIKSNSINVLLGANGTGKTTLFKCIMKHYKVASSNVIINNKQIENYTINELAKIISYVPQLNFGYDDIIVRDFIVEGRTPYLKPFSIPAKNDYLIVEKYAKILKITDLLGRNLANLSGGQIQLVFIARALTQETPIIIMDEPMSALDLANQFKIIQIMKQLQELGKTILFTSHNPNHAIILNANLLCLHSGKIIANGKAKDVINIKLLENMYSIPFETFTNNSKVEIFEWKN